MAPETSSASNLDAHDGDPVAEAAEAVHGHEVPAGTAEVAAHGEGGGLPQFQFEYWGGQIVWLLLLFAILYFLFSRVFVPRFRKVADERAATIAGALDEARRAQEEADSRAQALKADTDRARSESRRLVTEAETAAAAEMANRKAAQDAELAARMDKAEARIRDLREQAMSNVGEIAADIANAMVEKLTGRAVSPAEARAAEGVV